MARNENVMVRLSPEEAAGLDRLCERFQAKRGPTLRRLLAASVKRHDAEVDGGCSAGEPKRRAAQRPAQAARYADR